MKITNICDSEHLGDCGLPDSVNPINESAPIKLSDINTLGNFNDTYKTKQENEYGVIYEQTSTKVAAFETVNGESILVYYNPDCQPDLKEVFGYYIQTKICANFVYDLNGKKGPNTVGKDIGFISAIYPVDSIVVSPNPYPSYSDYGIPTELVQKCKEIEDGAKVPNKDELASLFFNKILLYGASISPAERWSSTYNSYKNGIFLIRFKSGYSFYYGIDKPMRTHCIKR